MWRSIAEIYTFITPWHDLQNLSMFKKKRVYLDYAAATPLSKAAFLAMEPHLLEVYGNPSAIHTEGMAGRRAVEEARDRVASTLQVKPEYVTFTSGGTESNNVGIFGTIEHLKSTGRTYSDMEVVTTALEHPSILKAMDELERRSVKVVFAPVDERGLVRLEALMTLLTKKTVLFSVAYANSEIGTVQKVRAIKKTLEAVEKKFGTTILFHVDAAQAPLWLPCQMELIHADLLALDVGKCNGPKGVGILVRHRRAKLTSALYGGGQESGLRPGTENVAGVVGGSVALMEAQQGWKERAVKVAKVRDAGIAHLTEAVEGLVLNGAVGDDRLANNINISIPGLDTEFAAVVLDKHGFSVSTKSACAGAGGGESLVVKEISGDAARSHSTLRFSLSPETTLKDIVALTVVLHTHCEQMKRFD